MSTQVTDHPAPGQAAREGLAIETEGLTKVYGRGTAAVRAVDGVDLRIPRGEVFGLLGPTGSGTTTTIKMLRGPVTPTAGGARLGGVGPTQAVKPDLRR